MEQIWGFSILKKTVEELRCTKYDSNNPLHEEKLLKLWTLLVPNENLESRVTKQWQYIGFQGICAIQKSKLLTLHWTTLVVICPFYVKKIANVCYI